MDVRESVEGFRTGVHLAFAFSADEEYPQRKTAYTNLEAVVAYLEGRRRVI